MIKVNYNPDTNFVLGYYPDTIRYNSIPEPFIEVTEEEHKNALGKEMVVIDGVFQEYIKSDELKLEEVKNSKILEIAQARKAEQYSNISVDGKEYINTETAQNKFFNLLGATNSSIEWRLATGEWVILSREDAEIVRSVIIASEKSAYQKESTKINEIEVITNDNSLSTEEKIARINNITW